MYVLSGREILQNLMAHEVKPAPSSSAEHVPDPQYSSSSSEDEDMGVEPVGGASSVSWMGTGGGGGFDDVEEFEAESSDDDDEGFTVKVGTIPAKPRCEACVYYGHPSRPITMEQSSLVCCYKEVA